MIFNRNAIWVGLLIGLALPFVGYALFLTIYEQLEALGAINKEGFSPSFRQRTLTIVAICLNIFPLNKFYKNHSIRSMRGIVVATTAYVIAWVVYFGKFIF